MNTDCPETKPGETSSPDSLWRHVSLIGGLLLVAANLRPAITGLAPLAERMQASGVSVHAIGLQTTVPLVLFGLAGLFVAAVGNRFGFARALGLGLLILALGCLVRWWELSGANRDGVIGAVLIGSGIAFGNVLLPGIVKSRYPEQVGVMTSLYSTALNLGAAAGIAAAVPLANALSGGWRASLVAWGVAALASLILWSPQVFKSPKVRSAQSGMFEGILALARRPRAWQVTGFIGLQSLLFYSCMAWLPTLLQVRGMSEVASYGWTTAMQLCGCAACLILPTLAGKSHSQSAWAAGCGVTIALSICGLLWLPLDWAAWSAITLGLGLNGGFGVALLLIAMRSSTSEIAGNLSSMAQAIGYSVAAPFPWFVGWLSEMAGDWTIGYGALIVPALLVAGFGVLAGRPGHVR